MIKFWIGPAEDPYIKIETAPWFLVAAISLRLLLPYLRGLMNGYRDERSKERKNNIHE